MNRRSLIHFAASAPRWLIPVVSALLAVVGTLPDPLENDEYGTALTLFLLGLLASLLPRALADLESVRDAQEQCNLKLDQSGLEHETFENYAGNKSSIFCVRSTEWKFPTQSLGSTSIGARSISAAAGTLGMSGHDRGCDTK